MNANIARGMVFCRQSNRESLIVNVRPDKISVSVFFYYFMTANTWGIMIFVAQCSCL